MTQIFLEWISEMHLVVYTCTLWHILISYSKLGQCKKSKNNAIVYAENYKTLSIQIYWSCDLLH